jgi:transposase
MNSKVSWKSEVQQPIEVREQVSEVSVDMWGGFPKVIQEVFLNAVVVYDRFHMMKYVNEEFNKIRIQSQIKGKGSRFIILRNGVDLKEEERIKLATVLSQSKRIKLAYELKEEFRDIFESHHRVEEGKKLLLEWIKKAQPIYSDTLTMLRHHIDGICNYFLNRTTSGVMEGINNRLKVIKRQAYGFVNFENFRVRPLACFFN